MIKKVYILTVMLVGILSIPSYSQGAQATMRVSVRVVSGSSVEMNQPLAVMFKSNKKSGLGMLTLRGINKSNVLISNSGKIKLSDNNGNEAVLDIISTQKTAGQNEQQITYEGISKGKMVSSVYKGELTTTIEYF